MRKTKIIATIGPASQDPAVLEQLVEAGMDAARLNVSHGTLQEHGEVIDVLRRLRQDGGRFVAIMEDLGGAKLRLGRVRGNFRINVGETIDLVPEPSSHRRDALPFPHPEVMRRLRPGSRVFIADGTISLEVTEAPGPAVRTRVTRGGIVSSLKGVNVPGVDLDQPLVTERERAAIRFGVEHEVDWLAISFVRRADEVREVRDYVGQCGGEIPIVAKLERPEAIENLDAIVKEAEAVMVARGDLGVELPMATLPVVQKQIVAKANDVGRPSIIATQMLRSMMVTPVPTRAEVSDICTAVLDGCDAILLSDETAIGEYPVEAVRVARATIEESEKIYPYYKPLPARDRTQAIAGAAASLVKSLDSHPMVVTSTGRAAFEVSRFRPSTDILVFSHDEAILRRVCLGWGLVPVSVIPAERDIPRLVSMVVKAAVDSGQVSPVDTVTIVHGFLTGVSGTTSTIQVLNLKDYLAGAPEGPP
ncbi:MAG: pyruvate kinase [Chloroflexi bacterium]|nr:pyruvate kinase [Chloroflexota bacterium]